MTFLPRRFPWLERARLPLHLGVEHREPLDGLVAELGRQIDWFFEQVANELEQRTEITNLGPATVTGAATTGTFTFPASRVEPNTSYSVSVTPVSATGSPAAGSNRVLSVSKSTTGVTLTVEAGPGAGATVTFDVVVLRVPNP